MKASVVGVCLVFGLLFVSCYDDSPSSGQVFVCDPTGDDCGDSGVCVQAGMLWVCSSDRKCSPACRSPEVCVNGNCDCFPSCTGLECGDDGCGGSCGKCPAGESWSCIAGKCVDDCSGLECGESPELGADCGTCVGATMWCVNNACADDCANRECGDSLHIGVNCGDCEEGYWCDGGTCKDDCAGLECGASPNVGYDCGFCSGSASMFCDDGQCGDDCSGLECGQSPVLDVTCGTCPEGDSWSCDEGACEDDCEGLECGLSPSLEVNCGVCDERYWCNAGTCEDDCGSAECGNGPHSISCGSCPVGESIWCDAGACKDDCAGRQCGDSPILGVPCGTCPDRSWCNGGTCEDDCGSAECGNGPHSISCGSCPVGESMWCDAGACKDDCAGRQCGDSFILGVPCGTCPDRFWCNAGTCEDDCGSAECGDGPHGISCGLCAVGESMWCDAGVCKDDCEGRQCGNSPFLDVSCGTCPDRSWCNAGFCEDDCGSAECGSGPHGIPCGSCPVGETIWCDAGVCKDDCDGIQCGQSPTLEVNCGTCGDRNWCNSGICEDDCGSAECGPGVHGISCGSCPAGEYCDTGSCHDQVCEPLSVSCNGNVSETCNELGSAIASSVDCSDFSQVCHDGDCCTPDCSGLECGDDGCGGSCGPCAPGASCASGECHVDEILIPAVTYKMGCNSAVDSACFANEKPYHTLGISAFRIDKTEVTKGEYRKCVDAGVCSTPTTGTSTYCNWNVPETDDHPANCVTWYQAVDYCSWRGMRLPTEAEWELAARGLDGRKYPWGNSAPSCSLAAMYSAGQVGCGTNATWPVCSKAPAGNSPYGLCDMAGNVWEWVSDWYSSSYYSSSPSQDPQGPETGVEKGVRGGSIATDGSYDGIRVSSRAFYGIDTVAWATYAGFRCASNAD